MLPVLYGNPVVEIRLNMATVSWLEWNAKVDYGTGPVTEYRVYYGEDGQGLTESKLSTGTKVFISDLKKETDYEFSISCYRILEGATYEGPKGNVVKNTTGCRGKNKT